MPYVPFVDEDFEVALESLRQQPQTALPGVDARIEECLRDGDTNHELRLLAVRCEVLLRQGSRVEAVRLASQVIARCKDHYPLQGAMAHRVLGMTMADLGYDESALLVLEEAAALMPDDAPLSEVVLIKANVASVQRRLGLVQPAARSFDLLVPMLDRCPPARRVLCLVNAASTWWQVDRADDALQALDRAQAVAHTDTPPGMKTWVHAVRSWVLASIGRVDEARQEATLALDGAEAAAVSSALRMLLQIDGPTPDLLARCEALTLEATAQHQLSIVTELALTVVQVCHQAGQVEREAAWLRTLRDAETTLKQDARRMHAASSEVQAEILVWRMESEALRAQAAQLAEANARLEELAASRSRLLQAVAHDLRSPLTTLTLGLALLRSTSDPQLLDDLRGACDSLATMLDRTLTAGSILAGDAVTSLEDLDLSVACRQAVDNLRLSARQHDVTLNLDAPPSLVQRSDGTAIQRIVFNLVSNAIKFTPRGRSVTVSLEQTGSSVVLSVADQGLGFGVDEPSELLLDRQQGAQGATVSGSYGMGLHTVYRLASRLGGTVHLSDRPEGGALAQVRLPARSVSPPEEAPSAG